MVGSAFTGDSGLDASTGPVLGVVQEKGSYSFRYGVECDWIQRILKGDWQMSVTIEDLKGTSFDGSMTIPYRRRNMWKGEIRPGDGWIEKDYGAAPLLPRLYGRICLRRERQALNRLKGIDGVPLYLGRRTRNLIRMTRLRGTPLEKLNRGALTERCFQRLRELVHDIHSRGVAHGDLHMRNILIDEERPSIIDFSNAYIRGGVPLLDEGLFRIFVQLDHHCLYKVENKFFGRGTAPRMFYLYRLVKGRK